MFSHKSLLVLIILFFSFTGKSQEAYKLPDVTRLRCDLGEISQLDEPAIQMAEKNAKAMFIVYGRKGQALRYIDYLKINFLKFRFPNEDFSKNLSLFYGGYTEQSKMEIWIVPQRAKQPELSINNDGLEKMFGIFDSYGYWYQYCPDTRIPALKIFADELKQNPTVNGYIVVHYYDKNSDEIKGVKDAEMASDVQKGQRASITDKNLLINLGVKSSRIFTIDIGYNKSSYASYAELWIVPKDSTPKIVLMNEN